MDQVTFSHILSSGTKDWLKDNQKLWSLFCLTQDCVSLNHILFCLVCFNPLFLGLDYLIFSHNFPQNELYLVFFYDASLVVYLILADVKSHSHGCFLLSLKVLVSFLWWYILEKTINYNFQYECEKENLITHTWNY